MISPWGVEHSVSKSYVAPGKFVSAAKLTPRGRQSLKNDLRSSAKARRKGRGQKGTHYRSYRDEGTEAIQMGIKQKRANLGRVTGKDFTKPPTKDGEIVRTKGRYPNAHPDRWGSKKGGKTRMVVGPQAKGKKHERTLKHERMHADKRSSWRLGQIENDPVKIGREEARADTLSGTYKQTRLGSLRTHTEVNRKLGSKSGQKKVDRAAARVDRVAPGHGVGDNMRGNAKKAKAFTETQDKINTASGGKFRPAAHARRTRATRGAVYGGGAAAAGGGLYASDKKAQKKEKQAMSKSVWGVNHG